MVDELGTQISELPGALTLVTKLTGVEVFSCDLPNHLDARGNPTTAQVKLSEILSYLINALPGSSNPLALPDDAPPGVYVPILTSEGVKYWDLNNFLTRSSGTAPITDDNSTSPSPSSYDSHISFASSVDASIGGVSGRVVQPSNAIAVKFNAITEPSGTPVTANFFKNGAQFLSLTFPSDYLNQPLVITDGDGATHDLTFVSSNTMF